MPKIIVMIGPPGAGKGTQSRLLAEHLHLPQISTGDILREMARLETKLGLQIKARLEAGQLVDDEILASVIQSRTTQHDCDSGYILDGYPRTPSQARTLEKLARGQQKDICLISIHISFEGLMQRLTGRRSCANCGEIFNIYLRPPQREMVCDDCGSVLTHRADDREETVATRLKAYNEKTAPLIEFFKNSGQLAVIDGARGVKAVFDDICAAVTQ